MSSMANDFRFVVAFQSHPAVNDANSLDNRIFVCEVTSFAGFGTALEVGTGVDPGIAVSGLKDDRLSSYVVTRTSFDSLGNPDIQLRGGEF